MTLPTGTTECLYKLYLLISGVEPHWLACINIRPETDYSGRSTLKSPKLFGRTNFLFIRVVLKKDAP